MNDDQIQIISNKLDIIINLLISSKVEGMNNMEATKYMSDIGLSNVEIANYFRIKPNVVRARLSNLKKRTSHKKNM